MVAKRGIFEREKGSGIWWIRWTDLDGHKRREKAGNRSAAEKLLAKRHTQKLEHRKLPENFRSKAVTFRELTEDALLHSKAENSEKQTYELGLRIDQLLPVFGSRPAESIKKNEIVAWLSEQAAERNWASSSRNRWQATFSLIFRVGIDNEKIERNPAARIRRKTEGNGRVRFLSDAEEAKLRSAIQRRFPEFLPHFLLSIHSGMRMGEQYSLLWNQVSFERRQIHLPKTKNGHPRTLPLNTIALAALKQMRGKSTPSSTSPVFPSAWSGGALQGSRGRPGGPRPARRTTSVRAVGPARGLAPGRERPRRRRIRPRNPEEREVGTPCPPGSVGARMHPGPVRKGDSVIGRKARSSEFPASRLSQYCREAVRCERFTFPTDTSTLSVLAVARRYGVSNVGWGLTRDG